MTPLILFLLGCATVFLGTVQAAFSALMRLSLRLMAERGGRTDRFGRYLDDPLRLFIPVRILLALCFVLAGVLIALRPSTATLTLPALIALGGSVFYALLMITTRMVKETDDIVLMTSQFFGTFAFGAIAAPEFAGMPECWMSYLAVDDVDQRVAKALKAGARLMKPIFDVPDVGRIAVLTQPGGAGVGWMTPFCNEVAAKGRST